MSFVDLSIHFQAEVTEEHPGAASNIAQEGRPNHPHLEHMRVILYSRPSGIVVKTQAGRVQDALGKALATIERHVPEDWENGKKQRRPPAFPELQADDLQEIGILIGEVYDDKIIREGSSVREPVIV